MSTERPSLLCRFGLHKLQGSICQRPGCWKDGRCKRNCHNNDSGVCLGCGWAGERT